MTCVLTLARFGYKLLFTGTIGQVNSKPRRFHYVILDLNTLIAYLDSQENLENEFVNITYQQSSRNFPSEIYNIKNTSLKKPREVLVYNNV